MPSLPIAPPQLDVAGPRSVLGPCRSGRARASPGTNGCQGLRGPAGRRASISAAGMMQVGDSACGPGDHEACVSKDPHSHVDPTEGT
jgi:hypothetical protein